MKRTLKPEGTIAAYVWDYSGKMEFLRIFWDAAVELDPEASHLDEGVRFTICDENNLKKAFEHAGLKNVITTNLDIPTVFQSFQDYWDPFLGGQGPAPTYLSSLNEESRNQLKKAVSNKLKVDEDGTIQLTARAIGVRGHL